MKEVALMILGGIVALGGSFLFFAIFGDRRK